MLKNKTLRDPEKQKEVEGLLGPVSSEKFADLTTLGKLITDYVGEGEEVVVAGKLLAGYGVQAKLMLYKGRF